MTITARPVDLIAEKVPVVKAWDANERIVAKIKPREWTEILTTQSGIFTFQVIMPDGKVVSLTTLTLTVEEGNVGVLSCRAAAGQREIPPIVEEE